MKIFCPINENSDINELIKYSDEFYMSYKNEDIHNDVNNLYHTRGFNSNAIFSNKRKAKEAIDIINMNKKEVFLTCNAHSFSSCDIDDLKQIMNDFKTMGGHGFIVSDLNTLKIANELGLKVYLSTIFAIYNVEAIKALLKYYHIDRIILARDVSFREIKAFKEQLPIEVECFIFLSGCRFSNGNCFCMHLMDGGMCRFSMNHSWEVKGNKELFDENHDAYSNLLMYGCGLCGIFDFMEIGIDSIKITGREFKNDYILDICKNIYKMREIAKNCTTKEEYIHAIEKLDFIHQKNCDNGFDCFYPELGKWKQE